MSPQEIAEAYRKCMGASSVTYSIEKRNADGTITVIAAATDGTITAVASITSESEK